MISLFEHFNWALGGGGDYVILDIIEAITDGVCLLLIQQVSLMLSEQNNAWDVDAFK